ncbi:MAG: hypothetical protein NTW60_02850 [Candidatus Wolfebacteria bacterium]|nr:hypothetical protein [Candidatus Wolfebacteria bacterium]
MGAGENFLILNFLDDYFEAALLRTDFSKKNLVLISLEKENYESRDKFKKIFRRAFPMRSYKVILALDSKRAFTGHWNVSLVRDNREGKVTQADLENFVSRAIWKVFDNGRKMSGSQLGLNDADSLLVDTRIYDFKIDGRRVIDPLKHDGGKFDVSLSQTFTSRLFMEQMRSMLPKRAKLAFIVESGVAASRLLSHMDNKKNFIFAKVMKDETDIFISKKERKNPEEDRSFVSFLDYFEWGANDFYRDLGKEIAAEPEIAEAIAETFFTKELSLALERRLENILSEKMMTLNRGLANAATVAKCDLVYPEREFFIKL